MTPISFPDSMAAKHGDFMQCLPRAPTVFSSAAPDCLALLGTSATACTCPADQGLQDVTAEHKKAVAQLFKSSSGGAVASCVCEIKPITSADAPGLAACQQDTMDPVVDASMKPVSGYCYVGAENPTANVELLAGCAATEQQGLRFLGRPATREAGDVAVVACASEDCSTPDE